LINLKIMNRLIKRKTPVAEDPEPLREFTLADLATRAGAAGQPVYIAFQGKVYDVSGSGLWEGGQHMGSHAAGQDLTGEFADAPHGEEVFSRYPQVGIIKAAEATTALAAGQSSSARQFWHRQITRVPLLRRHPHPMVVHFPIVFMIATTAFTVLYLLTGVRSFEVTGFHCLAGGVLFTPVAMVTGWFTWWLNYESRWLTPVAAKLILSPIMLVVGAGLWVWRWLHPEILTTLVAWPSLVYLALICSLAPLVSVIGLYGALLTFPLHAE
jgi:predicted heme/steroid binding protein/uncharacterized membrane protein